MKNIYKYIGIILVIIFSITSCTKKYKDYIEKHYCLDSAYFEDEKTNDIKQFDVVFDKNGNIEVSIYYITNLIRRAGTYEIENNKYIETSNNVKHEYILNNDILETTFRDGEAIYKIMLKEYVDPSTIIKEVDFESVLFGDSIDEVKIFNYCPAVITETKDNKEYMHVWYCTNKDDGIIMDHVGYRVGEKQNNGKWVFSEQKIVLVPTSNTWDGRHTCDPAVIKGEFNYNNESYSYLMAYLGCVTEDYQKNETGLAVSKDIGGPWVKIDAINPIIPWYDDGNIETEQAKYDSYKGTSSIYWGTGMPALINLDGKSDILLFYQSTLRGVGVRRYDFSNLNNPILKFTSSVSHKGVINPNGTTSRVGIADFMLDLNANRLYVASVTNIKIPADITLTRVNSHSYVAYMDGFENVSELCDKLVKGVYSWNMVGYVGPEETKWNRNHNPGLVRNSFGQMAYNDKVDVIVSTGTNDRANENIFTYRLFGHSFKL